MTATYNNYIERKFKEGANQRKYPQLQLLTFTGKKCIEKM